MIRTRFVQFVMATHAIEIINEAEPNEVVSINRKYRSGKRVNSDEGYSALFRYLGSSGNADFARIAKARKVIFVEGQDGRLLRRVAARLGFARLADAQGTPIVQLGGFSQWRRAVDAVWAFNQLLDIEIEAFCLFDRDYRCDAEIQDFKLAIQCETVKCRVHDRKEIENHLLVLGPIQKSASKRLRSRDPHLENFTGEEIYSLLVTATDSFKHQV